MLKFKSAPDYEMPRGKAMSDTNTNEYMVTVMAENGGEMEMEEVTVTVDNVEELGTLEGNASISYDENDTGDVGTYTTTGPDTATWSLDGDDADDFSLSSGGVLTFSASPDFEAPADANKDNDYMVTVMASAGGEMAMQEVTVMVDNVEEAGAVTLNPTRPSVGTPITASLEDSDIVEGTVSWQWASADAMDGDFEDITGADSDTYTPAAADAGMYLMATATYTDSLGSDSANMVSSAAVSQLAVNGEPEVEHPENVTNVAPTWPPEPIASSGRCRVTTPRTSTSEAVSSPSGPPRTTRTRQTPTPTTFTWSRWWPGPAPSWPVRMSRSPSPT